MDSVASEMSFICKLSGISDSLGYQIVYIKQFLCERHL